MIYVTTSENGELGPIASVVATSLHDARLKIVDQAAAALLLTYAKEIDMGGDLAKLGLGMLRVLDALQMTPKARAVAQRGGPGEPGAARSGLDELRARRDRKRHPEAVDPTAP